MIKNDIIKEIKEDYLQFNKYIDSLPINKQRLRTLYKKEIYDSINNKEKKSYYKPYKDDLREPLSYEAYISFKTLSSIHLSKFRESRFKTVLYLYTILNFTNIDHFYKVIKELEDKQYIEFKATEKGLKLLCFNNYGYQINVDVTTAIKLREENTPSKRKRGRKRRENNVITK